MKRDDEPAGYRGQTKGTLLAVCGSNKLPIWRWPGQDYPEKWKWLDEYKWPGYYLDEWTWLGIYEWPRNEPLPVFERFDQFLIV